MDIALERINIISQICQFIEHSYLGLRDCGRISSFGTVSSRDKGLKRSCKRGTVIQINSSMDFDPSQHLGSIFRTVRFKSPLPFFDIFEKSKSLPCIRRRQQQSSFIFRPLKNFMARFSPDIDLKMHLNPR